MVSTRLFILAILCIGSAICEKKPCDLEDEKCLTNSARLKFHEWITGMPGVESSEPLKVDKIEANLPKMYYKMTDSILAGMKDCTVEKVIIDAKSSKYYYHLTCPQLTFEAGYELKGEVGPHFVEGNGKCRVDHYGYKIQLFGDYEKKDNKDGKPHIHLSNFEMELQVTEKVVYDFKNLFNGNKEKSDEVHQFINKNWEATDKGLRTPAMKAFMKKFVKNVNDYLAIVPVTELFTEE